MGMETAPTGRRPLIARALTSETFASLRLTQFRYVMAGTVFSQVGGWMEQVARSWLALELTGSAFQLGLLAFINGISSLVASPVAGYLTDRFDRRVLAAGSQTVYAATAVALGLLVTFDTIALWQLYITAVIGGVTIAVNMPARQVLVYDVVGPDYITNAIALNSVSANVARIGAPSIGGGIIASLGIAEAYYAQTAFFLLATVATSLVRPETQAKPVRVPFLQGLREGVEYVRADPVVRRLVLLNAVPNLLIYPYVAMIPIFADDVLHVGSAGYGLLLSGVGFGSIPGGLAVASMSKSRHQGRVMATAALLYMGFVAAFAASSVFVLSFGILIVAGLGWSMMAVLNQTLLQLALSQDAFRGRVLSFHGMASGLTPFGSLGMGTVADRYGVQTAVASFALAGFALAAYLGWGSRRIRQL